MLMMIATECVFFNRHTNLGGKEIAHEFNLQVDPSRVVPLATKGHMTPAGQVTVRLYGNLDGPRDRCFAIITPRDTRARTQFMLDLPTAPLEFYESLWKPSSPQSDMINNLAGGVSANDKGKANPTHNKGPSHD